MHWQALTRKEYTGIRKRVRKSIFINSKEALLKRTVFKDKEVLMGGVVIEKEKFVEQSFQDEEGNVQISKLVPFSKKDDFAEEEDNPKFSRIAESVQLELSIFDFSGVFTVSGFIEEQTKDMRLKLFSIKEGNILYILGKIIPMNTKEGYFLLPSEVLSEDELQLHKIAHKEKFSEIKQATEKAKRTDATERVSDALYYNSTWNPMEVIRQFLKKSTQICDFDYCWLVDTVYYMYQRNPSLKLARIVAKYYYKYLNSSSLEEGTDKTKLLLFSYPALSRFVKD